MWVVFAHDVADDVGAFLGWLVDGVSGIPHIEKNAALNRLEPISGIRDGAVLDDVSCV